MNTALETNTATLDLVFRKLHQMEQWLSDVATGQLSLVNAASMAEENSRLIVENRMLKERKEH